MLNFRNIPCQARRGKPSKGSARRPHLLHTDREVRLRSEVYDRPTENEARLGKEGRKATRTTNHIIADGVLSFVLRAAVPWHPLHVMSSKLLNKNQ